MKFFAKLFLIPGIVLLMSNCLCSQINSSNFYNHLKGSVKIVHVYKGGAAPTEEILEKLREPVAFSNTELFLKKTYLGNVVYRIKTDSIGNFDLEIKPGVYNIYLYNESPDSIPQSNGKFQPDCEEKFRMQSYGQLKVYRKGNSPLEITIAEKMNPCSPLIQAAPPHQN